MRSIPSFESTGPSSSTDNAIARWDGTTGALLQNSGVTIDDSGNIFGNEITVDTINSGVNLLINSGLQLAGSADIGGDVTVNSGNIITSGLVDDRDVGNLGLVSANQDVWYPQWQDESSFVITSDTAYFIYLGKALGAVTIPYVQFVVAVAAGAATPGEVGLFTTPLAGGNGNQTLTKVEATGTITALNSTGEKRNTSAFTTAFANEAHCWLGMRAATSAPLPNCRSVIGRAGRPLILTTATAGALTSSSTFAGVVPAFSTGSVGVHLTGWKV